MLLSKNGSETKKIALENVSNKGNINEKQIVLYACILTTKIVVYVREVVPGQTASEKSKW